MDVIDWARNIPVHDLSDGRGLCRVIFAEDFLNALKDLPSAQPEPCEDAVSRADVEHEIANILRGIFVEYQDIAKKTASKLPSVTPKRKKGRWIYGECDGQDGWYCSECGGFVPWDYDYYGLDNIDFIKDFKTCPRCDARMILYTGMEEGEQDG